MAYTPQIYWPQSAYQNQYQNYQMQPVQQPIPTQAQPNTQNNGLIWVSGEIGAKSYLMAPNSTVMLMDSESETFFIKTTDNAGMPTLRIFEYKEKKGMTSQEPAQQTDMSNQYVTREEYSSLIEKYEFLEKKLKEATQISNTNPKTKKKVEEVTENE